VLKYKILIKILVLSCLLICCVFGTPSRRIWWCCDSWLRWKHVGGYAGYNTINLHICMCTCWSYIS